MRKISNEVVLLTNGHKDGHVKIFQELLSRVRDDPNFLENVIAGDEW